MTADYYTDLDEETPPPRRSRAPMTFFCLGLSVFLLSRESTHGPELPGPEHQAWFYAAFALSAINLALWSYNLFIFLLLRVLPIYFDKIKTPPIDMAYTVVPIPKTNAN